MRSLAPENRIDAVDIVLDTALKPIPQRTPLLHASGRVLANTLHADRDHPPFNRATMDGYAVRAEDIVAGAVLEVAAEVAAGTTPPTTIAAGSCLAIATGARVPESLNAVIEHELSDRSDPVRFDLNSVEAGRNIHPRGVDRAAGDALIIAPCTIGPAELGAAAASGHAFIDIARPPLVIVVSTGEELIDIDSVPNSVQVRDSNAPMIASAAIALGGEVVRQERVPDDLDRTIDVLLAASQECDLLITIGGVSAGDRDFIPAAWERLGAKARIERVPIQPGHPTHLWQHEECVGLALPGNPVSALVCMHLFARPWIRASLGLDPLGDWQTATLAHAAKPNPRRTLYRACTVKNGASIPTWHGSGDLPHLVETDGIIELPVQDELIAAGTTCPYLPWKG